MKIMAADIHNIINVNSKFYKVYCFLKLKHSIMFRQIDIVELKQISCLIIITF